MSKKKQTWFLAMILLMSSSLVSCFEPDTDSKPPDVTKVTVTEMSKPVPITTTSLTSVSSAVTVTNPAVTVSSVPIDDKSEYSQAEYEYDKLGRLIKVKYDDLNYIEYEYDANGNIKKITKTENGKAITDSEKK